MKLYNRGGLSMVIGMAALVAGTTAGAAESCMRVGGWGTGALEGFASFMAEAAMKNSAKSRLGTDSPKIGAVAKRCEIKGLLYECTARARACK